MFFSMFGRLDGWSVGVGRANPLGERYSEVIPAVHVALTNESRLDPRPVNCDRDWDLVSCLHAVGCALAHVPDDDLNHLIRVVEKRHECLPLASAQRLLNVLSRLDWQFFLEEVADMHGEVNRDWYRKMTLRVIKGLKEAVRSKQDLLIRFVDWEKLAGDARLPVPRPNA